jgi:hypothetical protein
MMNYWEGGQASEFSACQGGGGGTVQAGLHVAPPMTTLPMSRSETTGPPSGREHVAVIISIQTHNIGSPTGREHVAVIISIQTHNIVR